ncbi:MAG TPA: hypothetical protein VFS97_08930, partial [Nitrososphaeraceae archaeon]|nr:hypothetical protein [Nitrososphaeraceae archaeon]
MADKVLHNKNEQQQEPRYEPKILEYGDIYFFYRPKVGSQEVKSIDDVRRFFMVTAPEEITTNTKRNGEKVKKTHRQLYRLFVIGKKSLPEIRKSEARSSERYWARVGGIFERPEDLT